MNAKDMVRHRLHSHCIGYDHGERQPHGNGYGYGRLLHRQYRQRHYDSDGRHSNQLRLEREC